MNSFCRKMSSCLLDKVNKIGPAGDPDTQKKIVNYLQKYKEGKITGAGKIKRPGDVDKEKLAEDIPFKISLTHELCNMPHKIIDRGLPCSFGLDDSQDATSIKELFLVR